MTDYTVTIPPSSVSGSSDLLNFPLRIDMSVLPASFFTEARYDGGNVRAFNSANQQIPLEVQDFRKFSGGGTVWVKSDLSASSDTTITLRTVSGANTLERSSTYGEELLLCQRYYTSGSAYHAFPAVGASSSSSYRIDYPVALRAVPTVSHAFSQFPNVSSWSLEHSNVGSHHLHVVASAAGNTLSETAWTADAEL